MVSVCIKDNVLIFCCSVIRYHIPLDKYNDNDNLCVAIELYFYILKKNKEIKYHVPFKLLHNYISISIKKLMDEYEPHYYDYIYNNNNSFAFETLSSIIYDLKKIKIKKYGSVLNIFHFCDKY